MASSVRVSVLISGRGSNLGSLIKNAKNYIVHAVFSDNPDATGLLLAKEAGIRTYAYAREDYPNKEKFKDAIMEGVDEVASDFIALAGFMRVLPEWFVLKNEGKIINIHPALLPKFPGLHTHERAIEAHEKEHGCTVHYVDIGVDTGPIIAQGSCPVMPEDDADTLAARVLKIEHQIYPFVLNHIGSGEIALKGRDVFVSETCEEKAKQMGFFLRGEK
ncbi:MAG: phosphoribosylglycinamide formyltransferase [SAR324 cluster bacterium]|uniref:Phosphoribosylglycinamide formyltransferase n=1 Tax=SAR324 cluster bacterium TaxID=2024889 RepID=A0A7X9FVD4_9DELT|nr:phosphoribosylglycinamide formyltransferase [SAR324 cluster bacterium]